LYDTSREMKYGKYELERIGIFRSVFLWR